VRWNYITNYEAITLNEINKNTYFTFGKEKFIAGKDYIVPLEDVQEFYTFIEVCYNRLLCKYKKGHQEKCGFIIINSQYVVPYCMKDNKKYVLLFYFEGEKEPNTPSYKNRKLELSLS